MSLQQQQQQAVEPNGNDPAEPEADAAFQEEAQGTSESVSHNSEAQDGVPGWLPPVFRMLVEVQHVIGSGSNTADPLLHTPMAQCHSTPLLHHRPCTSAHAGCTIINACMCGTLDVPDELAHADEAIAHVV